MITVMRFALLLLTLMALPACTTVHETFEGRDPNQVWTALVAAANTPDYREPEPDPEWIVRENSVWVDAENDRIEIFRRLDRDYYKPASRHIHEDAEWKITVHMSDREPPKAAFTVRQVTIPSHAWEEARRYFGQVRAILGPAPEAIAPDQSTPPPPQPQSRPDRPAINIESLEPAK